MDEDNVGVGSDEPVADAPGSPAESEPAYITDDDASEEWEDLLEDDSTEPKAADSEESESDDIDLADTTAQEKGKEASKEEEKSADSADTEDEVDKLQETSVGWKRMRTIAKNRLQTIATQNQRIDELEQSLAGAQFLPGKPVAEWDAKAHLEHLATDYQPYHAKLVEQVYHSHLDQMPDDVFGLVLNKGVPALVQNAFGMSWDDLERVVAEHRNGGARSDAENELDPTKLAEALGLDELDPKDAKTIKLFQTLSGQLNAQRSQIEKLNKDLSGVQNGQKETSQQQREREESTRVADLSAQLSTTRKTVLDSIAKTVPKDRPKLLSVIDRAAKEEVAQDANYRAAKSDAEGYYKQGQPHLATHAIKLMNRIEENTIRRVAKEVLGDTVENHTLKRKIQDKQATKKQLPKGGTGGDPPSPSERPRPQGNLSLADKARQRWNRARAEGRA